MRQHEAALQIKLKFPMLLLLLSSRVQGAENSVEKSAEKLQATRFA